MGRTKQFPIKKLLGLDHDLMARIDQWRAAQRPIPNESDAIRALLDMALETAGIGQAPKS